MATMVFSTTNLCCLVYLIWMLLKIDLPCAHACSEYIYHKDVTNNRTGVPDSD